MADACCEGTLNTAALEAKQRRVLVTVLVINVATFALMVAGSWLSGSSSLLSGAMDNFGDALTYGLSFAAVGRSARAKGQVALVKGCLIMVGACAVAVHIVHHLMSPGQILVSAMGVAAALNLAANAACLWLLSAHRTDDVNMASVWECSRNDVFEGLAVIATAALVWGLESRWPDLVVACLLLVVLVRSAARVLANAWRELKSVPSTQAGLR